MARARGATLEFHPAGHYVVEAAHRTLSRASMTVVTWRCSRPGCVWSLDSPPRLALTGVMRCRDHAYALRHRRRPDDARVYEDVPAEVLVAVRWSLMEAAAVDAAAVWTRLAAERVPGLPAPAVIEYLQRDVLAHARREWAYEVAAAADLALDDPRGTASVLANNKLWLTPRRQGRKREQRSTLERPPVAKRPRGAPSRGRRQFLCF